MRNAQIEEIFIEIEKISIFSFQVESKEKWIKKRTKISI
jgi:hypothetical protein